MKTIILSPEVVSAIASLITALIGLVIRKIEKAPLDKKIKDLEANQQPTNKTLENE